VLDARRADDPVRLDAYNEPPAEGVSTTPRAEALRCLERAGTAAPAACCAPPGRGAAAASRADAAVLADVAFTDQDGERRTWSAVFDRPAVLAFFYSSCDNPRKCSATVTRLGSLQRAVRAAGLEERVRLALVTLDPVNDSPVIARRYAEVRGFGPGEGSPLLSTPPDTLERVVSALDAEAGFGEGRVNAHGVELFVIDRGRVAARLPSDWAEDDVVRRLREAAAPSTDSRER
jgi:protein SCO1/2